MMKWRDATVFSKTARTAKKAPRLLSGQPLPPWHIPDDSRKKSQVKSPETIRHALDTLGTRDPDIAAALVEVGYPEPRIRAPGFATLIGIIIGQQVSVSAAAAIRGRLHEAFDPLTPEAVLRADKAVLRGVGLSERKCTYAVHLAECILSGELDTDRLAEQDDEGVISSLTKVKGIGRWSAEIYMLFALGRADIWPAEDLAVQEALRRLKRLKDRPDRAESERIVDAWRPWRGVGALFLWHYYAGAPQ